MCMGMGMFFFQSRGLMYRVPDLLGLFFIYGHVAETAIVNYRLLLAKQGKQTEIAVFRFPNMYIYIALTSNGNIYIYIYICCRFKRKMETEAQAFFLNPFTCCSSCKLKFVESCRHLWWLSNQSGVLHPPYNVQYLYISCYLFSNKLVLWYLLLRLLPQWWPRSGCTLCTVHCISVHSHSHIGSHKRQSLSLPPS
jgi:hypothetical protein